jgi:hypothetical protein
MAGGAPKLKVQPEVIDVCKEARDEVDSARLAALRGESDRDSLDGHALLTRLKVAAALALLERRLDVSKEDWDLAAEVMAVSDFTRALCVAELARREAASNVHRARMEGQRKQIIDESEEVSLTERAVAWILSRLKDCGEQSGSALRNAMSQRLREHFYAAVDLAVSREQIVVEESEYKGRAKVVYELAE